MNQEIVGFNRRTIPLGDGGAFRRRIWRGLPSRSSSTPVPTKASIKKYNLKHPICIDTPSEDRNRQTLRQWYGNLPIPYSVVLDRQGRVSAHGLLGDALSAAREIVANEIGRE